ncbi:MAG TPA: HAD family phosphatase [Lacunisphaera sp.]|nr:HAD family phosphatase [Lacunisphaera sp.]
MPGEFSSKRAILFDLDGTLVDSSPLHAAAFVASLQPRHAALARAFDYSRHQGRPTAEVFRSLGVSDEEIAGLTRGKQERYRAAVAAGEVACFPGVPDLLARLHAAGRRLYVVTGASRRSTDQVLAGTGLARFFSGLITAEDTPRGKPAPDPYQQVVNRHGLRPADCLAVEDAANGIASARAAGLDAVLVNTDVHVPGIPNAGPVGRLAAWLLP